MADMLDPPEWRGYVCCTAFLPNGIRVLDWVEQPTEEQIRFARLHNSGTGAVPEYQKETANNQKVLQVAFGTIFKHECLVHARRSGVTLSNNLVSKYDQLQEVWTMEFSVAVAERLWYSFFGQWEVPGIWDNLYPRALSQCNMSLALDDHGNPKPKLVSWANEIGKLRLRELRRPFMNIQSPHHCLLGDSMDGVRPVGEWRLALLMNYHNFSEEEYARELVDLKVQGMNHNVVDLVESDEEEGVVDLMESNEEEG